MNTKLHFPSSLAFLLLFSISSSLSGQCLEYKEPAGSIGFTNFNTSFGGAPCDDGNGCPVDQITSFEVFASESYAVENFIAGGEYEFNICEGPGAGTWIPEFTIIAPSGNVDAFGSGTDGCRITWTASESGTYQIIINEAGQCGGGQNTETNNGYPTLSCLGNATCPDECMVWYFPGVGEGHDFFNQEFGGAPCDDGSGCNTFQITDIQVWAAEAYSMSNIQEGGEYRFNICDGPGAGAWVPDFTIISPSGTIDAFGLEEDSCSISWIASESGDYLIVVNQEGECGGGPNRQTDNGFPAITCMGGTMCDTTLVPCTPGTIVSETDVVLCSTLDSLEIILEGVSFPENGGIGFTLTPGENATGGEPQTFFLSGGSAVTKWNNDINGVLSSNNLEPLGGPWIIAPFTYEDRENIPNTVCSFTSESVSVFFNTDIDLSIEEKGSGEAEVMITGGTPPYTITWNDPMMQSSTVLTVENEGTYAVEVVDAVGCIAVDSISLMISSTDDLSFQDYVKIGPNPTSGLLNISLKEDHLVKGSITDVNGKSILDFSQNRRDRRLDLSALPDGLYFIQLLGKNINQTHKVIVAR